MIPVIRKILYCTDLSESAAHVFRYAAIIADRCGAGITILHVLEDVPEGARQVIASSIGEKRWEEIRKKNEQDANDILKKRVETFQEKARSERSDFSFAIDSIIARVGYPAEEILRQIEDGGFDLVVMGSHGAGRVADVMMGSTAGRVLRRSRKPVLIVRHPEETP